MTKNTLLKRLIAWSLCLLLTPVWGAERTTYYHLDLLGSPVAATDSTGQVVWREEYKPYGERTLGQDQNTGAPGYTGKVHEEALGLSYYGARWYDPELGRFTGIDPAGFQEANIQSFNRYAYANNNPYKYVDPDGEAGILALLIIIGVEIAFDTIFAPDVPFDSGVAQTSITLTPGPLKPLKGLSPVAKAVSEKVLNRANHLFGSKSLEKHNLGGFLDKFSGDQVKAFQSLDKATQKLASQGKVDGVFESVVKVKGINVTVRGKVVDGTANIGTAFIP